MLRYQNITKHYNKTQVVNSLNFEVKPGTILGFLGPNGAGKTTTIKMSCGLIKPSEGDIEAFGHSMKSDYKNYIKNIGAVLEGSRNIYWKLTPLENIRYYSGMRGIEYKAIKEKVDYYLDVFDLSEKRNVECGKLSRGMQQKVAICCSIIHEPKILFLDEPTLGLDVESVLSMEKILKEVISKDRIIILTSHDLRFVSYLCNEISIIYKGDMVLHEDISYLKNYNQKNIYTITVNDKEAAARIYQDHLVDIQQEGDFHRFEYELPTGNDLVKLLNELDKLDVKIVSVNKKEVELKDIFMNVIGKGKKEGEYEKLVGNF